MSSSFLPENWENKKTAYFFLKLQLTSEDVKGDEMDLGVAVLASLGGGHLHDLAGPVLRDDGDDCDDADDGDDGDDDDIKE